MLIAGAAGGNNQFLDFYRGVFAEPGITEYFDIANVHCISSDDFASFNVEPYQNMLSEFNITKPIWVTEAESFITDNPAINATQLNMSTKKAFELGAEKIFYTSRDFSHKPGGGGPQKDVSITVPEPDPRINPDNPKEVFQFIFGNIVQTIIET